MFMDTVQYIDDFPQRGKSWTKCFDKNCCAMCINTDTQKTIFQFFLYRQGLSKSRYYKP